MMLVETPSVLTDRLLAAAIELFSERGLDKAGVAAIARRAGVTTGAIYARWSGKQEMLLDALDLVMTAHLDRVLSGQSGRSADQILESLGADLMVREPASDALLMEALAAAHRDADFRRMLNQRLVEQEAKLAAVVDTGKDDGMIDRGLSTEAVVALCQAISFGFVMFAVIDKPLPAADGWSTVINRLITAALPIAPPTP